eukprot:6485504-Amphidinium_carterae.1
MEDFQGNEEADVVPTLERLSRRLNTRSTNHLLTIRSLSSLGAGSAGGQTLLASLCERPQAWPRVTLPAPAEEEVAPQVLSLELLPQAPREGGPHKRVVEFDVFARCLDCCRHTGKVNGKFNNSYLRTKD